MLWHQREREAHLFEPPVISSSANSICTVWLDYKITGEIRALKGLCLVQDTRYTYLSQHHRKALEDFRKFDTVGVLYKMEIHLK